MVKYAEYIQTTGKQDTKSLHILLLLLLPEFKVGVKTTYNANERFHFHSTIIGTWLRKSGG